MLFVRVTERQGGWDASLIFSAKERTAGGEVLAERRATKRDEIKIISDDLWAWANAMGIVPPARVRKRKQSK